MTAQYVELCSELRAAQALEKVAEADDVELSTAAQPKLAEVCDYIYERVKKSASELSISEDLPRKEAAAVRFVDFMLSLSDDHRVTGHKLAASSEDFALLSEKLAVAVFVDEVLEEQLQKLSGHSFDEARSVQLLGREYAVGLMQGFLT